MIGFNLGREYKLSIAEILALFPTIELVFFDDNFLVVEGLNKKDVLENAYKLGGTKKIIDISKIDILEDATNNEGKFTYAINVYGKGKSLKELLTGTKKSLKNAGVSSRFVNKDFKNLNAAQIINEKLVEKGTDYNYVYTKAKAYEGKTIWVQDINAYSKRDYNKDRDMQTGMLPPKLAQMMVNLAGEGKTIYDPFVGLGTVLIEAGLLGFENLLGSDLNEKMVSYSAKNVDLFLKKNSIKAVCSIEKLNSKFINESSFFEKYEIDIMVTEGYLGEIMTKKNISIDRINKQRESLAKMYNSFFENLHKTNFKGRIVISFPFWDLNDKYIYFDEVYEIIEKHCDTVDLFTDDFDSLRGRKGSVLYKRESQLVGREIFKLSLKK